MKYKQEIFLAIICIIIIIGIVILANNEPKKETMEELRDKVEVLQKRLEKCEGEININDVLNDQGYITEETIIEGD